MKIAAISDTHGTRFGADVPPVDAFIHCGDTSARGTFPENLAFATQLLCVRCERGIVVPGNHDRLFFERPASARASLPPHFEVLVDRAIDIDGVIFYGSPWTLPFRDWHFMRTEQELEATYAHMPAEVDVLITHGPAYGFCDGDGPDVHLGSKALAEAIAKRKVGLHVFGHIHEAGGRNAGIHFNVAALDLGYQVVRGATTFEVPR